MNKVIVIFGPTGIGKTSLSLKIAKRIDGEIISADSMQIYKKMDIGTAKITEKEKQGIAHHMLNIISPNEEYSVGEYVKKVQDIIDDIISRGKTPIVVGGTGLYVDGLINGYNFAEVAKNEKVRKKYSVLAEKKGKEFVHNVLKKKDPVRASQLHPNDIRRVIRALEIIEANKNNLKDIDVEFKKDTRYILFGLNMEREKLYEKINLRVDKMFAEGLLEEVKSLLKTGVNIKSQSMQGIGYKETLEGWEKGLSEEEIKESIKQRTRNYAKRQLTFMRKFKNLIWINAEKDAEKSICELIDGCKPN